MRPLTNLFLLLLFLASTSSLGLAQDWPSRGGVYPHLTYYNKQGECGTGAVVPWADKLWVITYGPHLPHGSDDGLYAIDKNLNLVRRKESIGGTPANRMIHAESQQLFIGPYAIDAKGDVRVIDYKTMCGRHTGTARHLTEPAKKVYYATMEEGIYEVDVKTLAVKTLFADPQSKSRGNLPLANLPGYHGKGLYTGQGRLVYANNGEKSRLAQQEPDIPSGCLAEFDGKKWNVVRRNQFTEVRGKGDLAGGNPSPSDPLWAVGWDYKSVLLMLCDDGKWSTYRLPKASHTYDGAHGWNTEWPRTRSIGEKDWLMTMHGMFWRFPPEFSRKKSSGILPRSSYLKVVGDFTQWGDKIVLGCDDTAKAEFLNTRKIKNHKATPAYSHSNLWFIEPEQLDSFGPPAGFGAVWLREDVDADSISDPYLFAGFERRTLMLSHDGEQPVKVRLEVDAKGDNTWKELTTLTIPPQQELLFNAFDAKQKGAWVRLTTLDAAKNLAAVFQYSNADQRGNAPTALFKGAAKSGPETAVATLLVGANSVSPRALQLAAKAGSTDLGYYELTKELKLVKPETSQQTKKNLARVKVAAPLPDVLKADAASVIYYDAKRKQNLRLPFGDAKKATLEGPWGTPRLAREVATERDLANIAGIFYELPARNAIGIPRVRPIATHNLPVYDYASWHGLFVISGPDFTGSKNAIRSEDGKVQLWVGVIDDLWQLGKPRGSGGPWKETAVKKGVPSDPYLANRFDEKTLTLTNHGKADAKFTIEVDLDGLGTWTTYQELAVAAGKKETHRFPEGFNAYWIRITSDTDTTATAWLEYK